MKFYVICAAALLAVNACAPRQAGRFVSTKGAEPEIRVLLAEGDASYRVTTDGGLAVRTAGGLQIFESKGRSTVTVRVRGTSLNYTLEPGGSVGAVDGTAVIAPVGSATLSFDGVRYGGVLLASPARNGGVSIVNKLPLEQYLEGVLPHEIGDPGAEGYAAVKAQAVAARTYAIGKREAHKSESFDVYASVLDQVYKGLDGTTRVASAAVRDTRGRVASYRGAMVKAYYSSCCGGHTSDIRVVWPDREPADYLHGVRDADRGGRSFCRDTRYFRWRYTFTGMEIGDILRVTLPKQLHVPAGQVGALKDIRVEKRSDSGRVIRLAIETTTDTFVIEGDAIRWILMPDVAAGRILPSVMFRLDKVMERDRVASLSVSGGGNGHGVGMCQTGAIGMARKGYTYEMILAHYYPGCELEKIY